MASVPPPSTPSPPQPVATTPGRRETYHPFFPKALERIDPLLDWEQDSVIYQTFRRRRKRRVSFSRYLPGDPLGIVLWLISTVSFFASLYAILAYGLIYAIALGIVAATASAIQVSRERKPKRENVFPMWVTDLVNVSGGYHQRGLTDLWLGRMKGADLVKAWYLETNEIQFKIAMTIYPPLIALNTLAYLVVLDPLQLAGLLDFLALSLAAILIFAVYLLMIPASGLAGAGNMVRRWRETAGEQLRDRDKLKEGGGSAFLLGALNLVLAVLTVNFWDEVSERVQYPGGINPFGGQDFVAAVILNAVALLTVVVLTASPKSGRRRIARELLEKANRAFEGFMTVVVNGDTEDGKKWWLRSQDPVFRESVRWSRRNRY